MSTTRGAFGSAALRPVVADAALGAAVAVALVVTAYAGIGPPGAPPARPLGAVLLALAAAVVAGVAVRRRHPVVALILLNAVTLAWFAAGGPEGLITLVPLIGCYTLAARRGWRWGLAGAVPTALAHVVAVRVVLGDVGTVGVVPDAVLLVATATSAGAAVGYHRAVLAATQERLSREARTREERALRLVAEERLRIARELHDVVGHAMATVSVQAGMGLHVIDEHPDRAREALAAIKGICDEGLTDVKTVLGILRDGAPAGEDPEPSAAPRGGLDRLADLLDAAQAAGLRVELSVDGDPRPLPVPVDLAAYRIIQEALTNVLRHAGARTVRLALTHEPAQLLIRVRDDGAAADPGSPRGTGIDGMRERARALSGRLSAAPHPEGGYEVRAELPIPDRG